MKIKLTQLACMSLFASTMVVAAPNPASQDWVLSQITLSPSDWSKVCESGNINSPGGCFGDIGSAAFAKISRLSNNIIQSNSLQGSGPNTVWLRQLGHGTQCSAVDQYFEIYNAVPTTTDWLVGMFSVTGQNYSLSDGESIGYGGYPSYYGGGTGTVSLLLSGAAPGAHEDNPYYVYFTNHPQQVPTMYMVVISANSTHNGVVTPFQQTPQVYLETNGLC